MAPPYRPMVVIMLALLAMTASPLTSAQLAPWIPADSLDTLLIPQTYNDTFTQSSLLADLGTSLEGIKLLIKFGPTLGSGFARLPSSPATLSANLTTDPGLTYLATATQAYLAFIGAVPMVTGSWIQQWKVPTNSWYHAASSYIPGAPLFGNGGTFYSLFYFTLKDGPILITLPPFHGQNRWSIYFEDIYGSAFKVLGSDHGNNAGGSFYLVPAGWPFGVPHKSGFQIIEAPTIEGNLLGRSYYAPDAAAIAAFDLAWTGGVYNSSVVSVPLNLWPLAYPEASQTALWYSNPSDPFLFWRVAGEIFRRNGAHHIVDPLASLLPSIGLYPDFGFVQSSLSPLVLQALQLAPYYGNRILIARDLYIGPPELNYWQYPRTNGKFGSDYVSLAAIQKTFFIANEPQDAVYYYQYLDTNAQPLNGNKSYTITFPAPPPAGANSFFSIVANNLDNFINAPITATSASIAVGFYVAPDGSIPFRLSSTLPPANSTASGRGYNFVQLPAARFSLILRVYAPLAPVLSNTYAPPPVVPVARR